MQSALVSRSPHFKALCLSRNLTLSAENTTCKAMQQFAALAKTVFEATQGQEGLVGRQHVQKWASRRGDRPVKLQGSLLIKDIIIKDRS